MDVVKELSWYQHEMFCMSRYRVPFPLFVGGYGSGKSFILVENAVRDVLLFPGCKVAVYAPSYDLLELNLLPAFTGHLTERGIKHGYNKKTHIMSLPGNRKFIFRSMNDPSKIVAYEVYCSHVDEVDLMTTVKKGREAWDRIIGRNRQIWLDPHKPRKANGEPNPHPEHFNMVSGYSTPEGFKFTHERWKKAPGEGYKYVAAPTHSNINLDDTFVKNLEDTYTPEQCKAYLLGIWTNIFSGTVYSYFDRDRHHTDRILLPGEAIHVGCDFNYGGSCGSVYVPITNASKEGVTREQLHLLGKDLMIPENAVEYHRLNTEIGLNMVDEFTVEDTEQMVTHLQDEYPGRIITMFPDASGDSNSSNASMSDIAMLRQANFLINAHASNPRIADRINSVQRLLHNDLFGINKHKCPKTVESMEEHAYSERTGLPDKITGPATIDDRNDSMGYCPAFKFPIRKSITTISGN